MNQVCVRIRSRGRLKRGEYVWRAVLTFAGLLRTDVQNAVLLRDKTYAAIPFHRISQNV